MVTLLLFYLFCVLIFSCYSFNKLRKEIKNIVFALKYAKSKKINNNFLFNQKKFINNNYKINFKKQNENMLKKLNNKKMKLNLKKDNQINSKNKNKKIKKNNSKILVNSYKDKSNMKFGTIDVVNKKLIMKKNKLKISVLKLKDFEMNSLEYEEAMELDKRGYFEYYFSLLKNNHPLSFSCITFNDYNSFIIKNFVYFYSFSLDFTINALSFNDNTMHKIYVDKIIYINFKNN